MGAAMQWEYMIRAKDWPMTEPGVSLIPANRPRPWWKLHETIGLPFEVLNDDSESVTIPPSIR